MKMSQFHINIKEFEFIVVYNVLRLLLTLSKFLFCSIYCPLSTFKINNNNMILSYFFSRDGNGSGVGFAIPAPTILLSYSTFKAIQNR